MQVLGFKYREDFGINDFLPDITANPGFERLAEIIGRYEDTNLPVNDLNFMNDSRFVDYFNKPGHVPRCESESVLKPNSVETFAEHRQFCDYLVGEIDDANLEIDKLNSKEREKLLQQAKDSLKNDLNNSNNSDDGTV